MTTPKTITLIKPAKINRKKAPAITGFRKGDILKINLQSFGIDPLTNPKDQARAALGFGNCTSAINKGASNPEAFLYQYKSGQLFYNSNGAEKGFGDGGGLICVFKGAPPLTAIDFDYTGLGLPSQPMSMI